MPPSISDECRRFLETADAVERLLANIMPDNLYLGDDCDDDAAAAAGACDCKTSSPLSESKGSSSPRSAPPSSFERRVHDSLFAELRSLCRAALPDFAACLLGGAAGGFSSRNRAAHRAFVLALERALSLVALEVGGFPSLSAFLSACEHSTADFTGEGKEGDVRERIDCFRSAASVLDVVDVARDFAHFGEGMVIRAEQWRSFEEGTATEGGWNTGRRR